MSYALPPAHVERLPIGPCVFNVDLLDLTGLLPGFSFTGSLQIGVEGSCSGQDWHIESASAGGVLYTPESESALNVALYEAICKAVYNSQRLVDEIWSLCEEHG